MRGIVVKSVVTVSTMLCVTGLAGDVRTAAVDIQAILVKTVCICDGLVILDVRNVKRFELFMNTII